MKKKTKGFRWLAFVGVLAMTAGIFVTGCQRGGGKSSQEVSIDREHIFKADYLKAPEKVDISRVMGGSDRIYIMGYVSSDAFDAKQCLIAIGLDGKKIADYELPVVDMKTGYFDTLAMQENAEGELEVLYRKLTYDKKDPNKYEEKSGVLTYGKDGKQIKDMALKKTGDNFYPNNMLLDSEGNMLFLMDLDIMVYNSSGKKIATIKLPENSWANQGFVSGGKNYIIVYQYSAEKTGVFVQEVDLKNKKLLEPISFEDVNTSNRFYGGDSAYDFYMSDTTCLYGYRMDDKKKEKICNWIDSDINSSSLQNVIPMENNQFFISGYNSRGEMEFAIINKVEPKDVVEKEMFTIASIYGNSLMLDQVIEYNKRSDKYRFTVVDYSSYNTNEDYTLGAKQFKNDVTSGKTPDLLCVEGDTQFHSLASKGMFADLNELMKEDKDFKRGDYLENIFEAGSTNGKLYRLISFFDVYTVMGKTSVVGKEAGWTIDELMKIYKKQPKGTKIFNEYMTRSNILNTCTQLSLDRLIDWEKGTVSFDGEEFKKLLEFSKEFPKDQDSSGSGTMVTEAFPASGDQEESQYRTGKVMLNDSSLYSFEQYHQLIKETFGENVTIKGYPSENKDGSAIVPILQFAVFENTRSKEACWELLKSFLSDDYQDAVQNSWPVKLSSLEKQKKKAIEPRYYTDENGKKKKEENISIIGNKEVKVGYPNEKECDKVIDFLKGLKSLMEYDEKITTIIQEESGAYFEGQKDIDETVKIIQDRVKTYIGENK